MGASTVGADLCVRLSSPERSLFCGRTRRSAPTQATSARQFHSSNAVTSICRDTRSVRPLSLSSTALRLRRPSRSTTDAQIVRPYTGLHVPCAFTKNRRPLAVGRFVAPSRRGNAPNDCGVGKPPETSDLPLWEVGLEL